MLDRREISIILQAFMKSVVENYTTKSHWNAEDEEEIRNRVQICRNIYKHHLTDVLNNQNKGVQNGNNSQN